MHFSYFEPISQSDAIFGNLVLRFLNLVTDSFQMLNHTCSRENCICCELSFLYHMMDISNHGLPCQTSNFLRALRTIPEASALGLVRIVSCGLLVEAVIELRLRIDKKLDCVYTSFYNF